MKREADKKHSRVWWGTPMNAMIDIGQRLQWENVKSIKVTVERERKGDSLANVFRYRIDVRR